MPKKKTFKWLLEPLRIKQVRFRNRLVKTPQDMGYANKDGTISQRYLDFYETIARGGVGAIIVEHSYIDFPQGSRPSQIAISEDKYISGLAKLATVIQKHSCPAIQQINHTGPMDITAYTGLPAVAPSALSDDYMRNTFGTTYNLRQLTVPEIQELVEKFARAAERVGKDSREGWH